MPLSGSLGDLHPILALVGASRERGRTPVIAAAESYGGLIVSLGFGYRSIRSDFTSNTLADIFVRPRCGAAPLFGTTIFLHVRETYDDLLAAAYGVDVIVVGELVYPARLVADRLAVHWANAVLSPHIAETGDIFVVDAGGVEGIAVWGGVMTPEATIRKIGGTVIDGAVRDVADIRATGFLMFRRSAVQPCHAARTMVSAEW